MILFLSQSKQDQAGFCDQSVEKYNKRLSSGVFVCSLLWNSFQNDLAYTCITEEEISTYADDHQIFASGSSTSIVEVKVVRSLYGTRKTCYK